MASQALASGYLRAGADLAEARFYVSPAIDEQQVIDLIDTAIVRNPCIVHAAEGGATNTQKTLYRALHALGVAPPYWRFLPGMLSFPPLHFLRRRHPAVKAGRVFA
ncbi:MAG: hypothetical protein IPI73_23375 [Betaproteobacteria bacterium]|nr:hypothetical protein [Betaproteobacteria bacterium]